MNNSTHFSDFNVIKSMAYLFYSLCRYLSLYHSRFLLLPLFSTRRCWQLINKVIVANEQGLTEEGYEKAKPITSATNNMTRSKFIVIDLA